MRPRPPLYVRHATPVDTGRQSGSALRFVVGLLVMGALVGAGVPALVGLLLLAGFMRAR